MVIDNRVRVKDFINVRQFCTGCHKATCTNSTIRSWQDETHMAASSHEQLLIVPHQAS